MRGDFFFQEKEEVPIALPEEESRMAYMGSIRRSEGAPDRLVRGGGWGGRHKGFEFIEDCAAEFLGGFAARGLAADDEVGFAAVAGDGDPAVFQRQAKAAVERRAGRSFIEHAQ